jgi:hypothetical protein
MSLSTLSVKGPKFTPEDIDGWILQIQSLLDRCGLYDVVFSPVPVRGIKTSTSSVIHTMGQADSDDDAITEAGGDDDTVASENIVQLKSTAAKEAKEPEVAEDAALLQKYKDAYGIILSSLIGNSQALALIADVPRNNAAALYKRIVSHYKVKIEKSQDALWSEFLNIKQKNNERAADWIARYHQSVVALEASGAKVDGSLVRRRLVGGTLPIYNVVVESLKSSESWSTMSFEHIANRLLQKDKEEQSFRGVDGNIPASAHYVSTPTSTTGDVTCHKCGGPNHIARNCTAGNDGSQGKRPFYGGGRSRIKCDFCKIPGHTEEKCWKKHGKPGAPATTMMATSVPTAVAAPTVTAPAKQVTIADGNSAEVVYRSRMVN